MTLNIKLFTAYTKISEIDNFFLFLAKSKLVGPNTLNK